MWLLDTDVCVALLRRSHPGLPRRIEAHRAGDLSLSAITAAELRLGAEKSTRRAQSLAHLQILFEQIAVLPFAGDAVEAYGRIRAHLEHVGTPIGPLDTLIAAHAVSLGATLVTGNDREFRRVKSLRVENWLGDEQRGR